MVLLLNLPLGPGARRMRRHMYVCMKDSCGSEGGDMEENAEDRKQHVTGVLAAAW